MLRVWEFGWNILFYFPFQSPSTIHCGKRSRIFAQCNAFGFCVDIFRRSGGGYASWQRYEPLLPSCSSEKQIVHAYDVHFPHNFFFFFFVWFRSMALHWLYGSAHRPMLRRRLFVWAALWIWKGGIHRLCRRAFFVLLWRGLCLLDLLMLHCILFHKKGWQ